MPRSGILASYGSSVFSFWRKLRTVLHCRGTKFLSHQLCRRVPFSPHLLQHLLPGDCSVVAILIGVRWYHVAAVISLIFSNRTQMLTWRPLLPFGGGPSPTLSSSHRPRERGALGITRLLPWPTRTEVIQAAETPDSELPQRITVPARRSCPVSGAPPFRGLCHTAESQWKHTSVDLWINQEWVGGGWNIALDTLHLLPVLGSIDGDACEVLSFLFVPFYLIPICFHWKLISP